MHKSQSLDIPDASVPVEMPEGKETFDHSIRRVQTLPGRLKESTLVQCDIMSRYPCVYCFAHAPDSLVSWLDSFLDFEPTHVIKTLSQKAYQICFL